MICNHLFPRENEHAYTRDLEKNGDYVFTTRGKRCDFAAIEIKECYSKSCDVAFVKDDKKKINANVYSNSLQTGNNVHKKGATTDVTNGKIVSSEFYLKATDKRNRENIFLVKGTAEKFSERGDSGLLVFSRPNRIQQNYVDILGMVYTNDIILYDDEEDDDLEDQNEIKSKSPEGSWKEGAYNKEVNAENESSYDEWDGPNRDNNTASGINHDTNGTSFCCRIHTALDLFRDNQCGKFEVKFKRVFARM